jgi:hypothetical protein
MGISRTMLWQLLEGATPVIEPLLNAAYQRELDLEWRGDGKAPHGQSWATSFHASAFPGDSDDVCGRQLVYEMLDIPSPEPRKPFLQAWFDLGSHLEHDWVRRFASYGVLLTADVTADDRYQTTFEEEEVWLSGSCDAIVLPRGWTKSHVVEIKTVSHERLLAMLSRTPTFPLSHAKYLRQLKTYIGLAHELPFTPAINLCDESGAIISAKSDYVCPDHHKRCAHHVQILEPPDDGTLIYSSREEPLTVASCRVFYDEKFMQAGREKLAELRDYFLRGEIPPHPAQGRAKKWTSKWCDRCPWKSAFCKADDSENVTDLASSDLIPFAKSIRPDWDYESKRSSVLWRWTRDDEIQEEERASVG